MTELSPPPTTDFAVLADAAWPTLERGTAAGWQLRFAEGVTMRANSAWPGLREPDASPEALAAVERAYREHGLAPVFQLSGDQVPLRDRLIGRGYRTMYETLVLAASVTARGSDEGGVSDVVIADEPSDEWLGVWWSVDGRGGDAELEVARRILTGVPALYAGLRVDGSLVSVARLALVESWGGLYCVATLPDHRRRGYSGQVVRALLAAGAARGVTDAWLQVLASNGGAIALYSRLGFAEVDRYVYLVGQLRLPPAAACRS